MDNKQVLTYWQEFFADLFLGTFKNLFLFTFAGFSLGVVTTYLLKEISVQPEEWQAWLEILVLGYRRKVLPSSRRIVAIWPA